MCYTNSINKLQVMEAQTNDKIKRFKRKTNY